MQNEPMERIETEAPPAAAEAAPQEPAGWTMAPTAECRTILQRAHAVAVAWGWPHPGALSLVAALGEPSTLESLLDELCRGVLEPQEAHLLLEETRRRLHELNARIGEVPRPEGHELEAVVQRAVQTALERQETELRPNHLALALILSALQMGPGFAGAAEFLLLRRLALGPRLAGAPPASRRTAAIDLADYRIRSEVLDILPPKLCRQHGVVPLKRSGDTVYLACADPEGFHGYDDASFWTGSRIELVRVTPASLEEAMTRHLPDEARLPDPVPDTTLARASAPDPSLHGAAPVDTTAVPDSFDRLQRLIELDPNDQRYHGARGDLYMRLHYLKEASESYWRAADLCEEHGDWPRTVAYLRKLQEIQPSDRAIYRRLARNFLAMGMHDELLESFGTFADLSARADDFEAAMELYLNLSGRDAKEPELSQLLESAGSSYQSYLELVSAFMTLLRFHLGDAKSPDLYYLHIKVGLSYTAFGFNEEALAQYHKAVERCHPKGHSLWTVGVRALWEGNPSKAMELFMLGLDEPDLSMRDRLHIEYDLASCCEQKNDLFRAYQLLSDIKKVNENFLAADIAVRRLRTILHL